MKPLALTWYPSEIDEHGRVRFFEPGNFPLPNLYTHPRQYIGAMLTGGANWRENMRTKRLTEPELAAEFESARCDALLMREAGRYYSPLGDTWPNDQRSVDERAMTLLRFASLPHAAERNYE